MTGVTDRAAAPDWKNHLYRQYPRLACHEDHVEKPGSRLGVHDRPVSYVGNGWTKL